MPLFSLALESWELPLLDSSLKPHPPKDPPPLSPVSFLSILFLYSGALPPPSLTQLLCPGPSFPTLASPFSSFKNHRIFNHIASFIFIIRFGTYSFIVSFFCLEYSYLYMGWPGCPAFASLGQSSSRAALSSLSRPVQCRSRLALQTSLPCSTVLP